MTAQPIKGILNVYTAARDRNGNCYHAAEYIDTETGARVKFGNIGGSSNMDALPRLLGLEWPHIYTTHQTLPIREWQRYTKDWPYLCNHADESAAAAVQAAIAAQRG